MTPSCEHPPQSFSLKQFSSPYPTEKSFNLHPSLPFCHSRLNKYLIDNSLWTKAEEEALAAQTKEAVMVGIKKAEVEPKTPLVDLFGDVYDTPTANLLRQKDELAKHMAKYRSHYEAGLKAKRIKMDLSL